MSGPSKLSLAIALALIGGNAFALGLGSIQVKSGLNQPLDAEIQVTAESAVEASGLTVGLATAEDFQRVGLSRARVTVPIDFSVATNGRGQAVIKLTTKEVVREPFLDFLVEVNWPKGKLLREYTVLLDPPILAPAVRGSSATVAPAKEARPAPAQKLAEEKQPKPKPTQVKPPRTVAESKPKSPPASVAKAPPPAPAPAHAAAAGDYGPVAQGETLSEVARATKPDDSTNVNAMMLALLKANPNAFYKDNINALKRGAILRIPSNDEIKATGSSMAAAAAVREQNDSWSGNAAVAKPTVVANAGAPKTAAPAKPGPATGAKSNEHLALVPPRAGKDSQTTGDRPGPSTGTGASADSKADLVRTKEALASREQEAGELKSRVKQLEDLNGKDQRLISLKESEIADLQNKLKELQSGKSTASTTVPTVAAPKPIETPVAATTKPAEIPAKPVAETGTKGDAKLTAQDIWGNISAGDKSAPPKPATPSTTSGASTPATPVPPSTAAPTSSPATPSATPATTPTTGVSSPTATPPATTPAAEPTSIAGTATTTPVTTPTTTPTVDTAAASPASSPVKPATPAPSKPAAPPSAEQEWYQNNTALLVGGIGLLLIGGLALMRFMRKPKPVLMPTSPMSEADAHAVSEDEHNLLDALAQHPGDPVLSLELLTLYYSQRDAAKFEAAAEAMYAHIADPTQSEWQQVRAMGEELCPHNPLFGGSEDLAAAAYAHDEHAGFAHHATDGHTHDDSFDLGAHDGHAATPSAEDSFDFDLTDHAAAAAVAPAHATDFGHAATLVGHPTPTPPPAFDAAAAAAAKPAEDFFAGEDAIGTKLDLAKAYLDMGDPEGARSMLDEVMAEGSDTQKGEARKLLAEIR
jgi:pilus assembly protein FimV